MNHVAGDIRNTSDEYLKAQQGGGNCCAQTSPTSRPATGAESIIMDLSNQVSRAQDVEGRALAALDFFGKHPEFAEFIGLIRSGSISI